MMSIDPPRPGDSSDDDFPRRVRDAAQSTTGSSTDSSVPSTETLPAAGTRQLKRIGHYHIKRVIASGGMGTVYEATQEKPRRVVAIKLMKQGIASRSALRRFEYESQILARLRHPGIAQIYEAGTHRDDSGTTPYFAMEYIPNALPITKYVKEKNLGTRQKLELFASVCGAVHHGHQKGIIHRDLKPSNILVDSSGQVKVIDFGVARGTDSDMAVTTLQTDIGQLLGTLQYMSPEQCLADPHDIDTRSDVYALGVVFFELLSGRLPYNVSNKQIFEGTRIIREQQPTKLTTIDKTLKGDVETICYKALEKDRERRYQSAVELAQDVNRYLNGEAIVARPASIVYQLRVFARKNKALFGAVAAVFVVLLGGVIVSALLYLRAEDARSYARVAQANAEFQARSSRIELSRMVRDFDHLRPQLELAHHLAFTAEESQLTEFPTKVIPEADLWLRRLLSDWFPSKPDTDGNDIGERMTLEEMTSLLRSAMLGSAYPDVEKPAFTPLFDWIRSNDERIDFLIDQLKRHRFMFTARFPAPDSLLDYTDLDFQSIRHTGLLLAAVSWLRHVEADDERAAEALMASQRFARYVGDGTAVLGHIQTEMQERVYRLLRYALTDAAVAGQVRGAHEALVSAEPPARALDILFNLQARSIRQTINHVFVYESAEGPPSVDTKLLVPLLIDMYAYLGMSDVPQPWLEAFAVTEYEASMHTLERALAHLHRLQYQPFRELLETEEEWNLIYDNVFIEHFFGSSLIYYLRVRRRAMMERDATIVTLALCRYRITHGQWPDSLEVAIAESDPKPTRIEYFDAPFVYRVVDGYPLLYAVGNDFEDDGGRPKEHPIFLPDGSRKSDYVLVAPPDYIASFDTPEQTRSQTVATIARGKIAVEYPTIQTVALNDIAWFLLTCEPKDLRDPQAALPVAKRAVEMSGGEDAEILDTLALAYFMTGDTAKAIETQEKAVSILPPEKSPLRTELEANLAKYRAKLAAAADSDAVESSKP